MNPTTPDKFPKYQCHKIVNAYEVGKIVGREVFSINEKYSHIVPGDFFIKNNKMNLPGYLVFYEDGYISWSPKEAFEDGYTLIK